MQRVDEMEDVGLFEDSPEYWLPTSWISAFMYADESGLSDEECDALQKWEDHYKPGHCVCVSKDGEFRTTHDAWAFYPYAGDCSLFMFRSENDLHHWVGARIKYKKEYIDEGESHHVLVVKSIKKDKDGKKWLYCCFEHVGLFNRCIDPEKIEEVVPVVHDSIYVTINHDGMFRAKKIRVNSIEEIPNIMVNWKKKNKISNARLKGTHGQIHVNGELVGQYTKSGKLSLIVKLF